MQAINSLTQSLDLSALLGWILAGIMGAVILLGIIACACIDNLAESASRSPLVLNIKTLEL
jgi:hypothetical protein